MIFCLLFVLHDLYIHDAGHLDSSSRSIHSWCQYSLSSTSLPCKVCSGLVKSRNSHSSLNELNNDFRELQAEVKRLRALREDYERQMKMGVPRRLLQPGRTDLNDKDHEIEILKEQLKQSEGQLRQSEELAKAQK